MTKQERKQLSLLRAIQQAFKDVELGSGVTLHETIVIDNYGGPKERLQARSPDETQDWRKIDTRELMSVWGIGGPSFYDALGFRFHLPAYLSLAGTHFNDDAAIEAIEFFLDSLTSLSAYNLERFSILSRPQKQCVKDVLIVLKEMEGQEISEEHLCWRIGMRSRVGSRE